MRVFVAALSPELRRVMDAAATMPSAITNSSLQIDEQKWSRQLYYMMSLTTNGEALHRLQNVSEGEGAAAWRSFSEHFEPKTAACYLGMLKEILYFAFGDLDKVSTGSSSSGAQFASTKSRAMRRCLRTCCKRPFRLACRTVLFEITLRCTRAAS